MRVASHAVVSSIGVIGGGISPPVLIVRQFMLFYTLGDDLVFVRFVRFYRSRGWGAGVRGRGCDIYIYSSHRPGVGGGLGLCTFKGFLH